MTLQKTEEDLDRMVGVPDSQSARRVLSHTLPQPAPQHTTPRSYTSTISRSLPAASSVTSSPRTRHRQFPLATDGTFILPSLATPTTSCIGNNTVSATDPSNARIITQFISPPSAARYRRACCF